jgi:hypothetical protein
MPRGPADGHGLRSGTMFELHSPIDRRRPMKCFMLAAAAGAVLAAGCASEGAQPGQAHAATATATATDYEDPPVGTLIKRKTATARPGVGNVDPQALDTMRSMDNGTMNGQ